ncbi:hypothetical protein HDU67_004098 [Dinochytrium kinnereticum]|nr:hypothetical protein HDU67_004098 [Dinochytrium kinnereticum]
MELIPTRHPSLLDNPHLAIRFQSESHARSILPPGNDIPPDELIKGDVAKYLDNLQPAEVSFYHHLLRSHLKISPGIFTVSSLMEARQRAEKSLNTYLQESRACHKTKLPGALRIEKEEYVYYALPLWWCWVDPAELRGGRILDRNCYPETPDFTFKKPKDEKKRRMKLRRGKNIMYESEEAIDGIVQKRKHSLPRFDSEDGDGRMRRDYREEGSSDDSAGFRQRRGNGKEDWANRLRKNKRSHTRRRHEEGSYDDDDDDDGMFTVMIRTRIPPKQLEDIIRKVEDLGEYLKEGLGH